MSPASNSLDSKLYGIDRKDLHDYYREKGIEEAIPRESGSLQSRIYGAAEYFGRNGHSSFTLAELASIVYYQEWDSPDRLRKNMTTTVSGSIRTMYQSQKDIRADLNLPWIQLLRIETGNYSGNMHTILGYEIESGHLTKVGDPVYSGIRGSPVDWQQGTHLPLPSDFKETSPHVERLGKFLGYIWTRGALYKMNKRTPVLTIGSVRRNEDLLYGEVHSLASKTHRVQFSIGTPLSSKVAFSWGDAEMGRIAISRGSIAIGEYYHLLGLPFGDVSKTKIGRRSVRMPIDDPPAIIWNPTLISEFLVSYVMLREKPSTSKSREGFVVRGKGKWGTKFKGILYEQGIGSQLINGEEGRWVLEIKPPHNALLRSKVGAERARISRDWAKQELIHS